MISDLKATTAGKWTDGTTTFKRLFELHGRLAQVETLLDREINLLYDLTPDEIKLVRE